MRTPSTSPLPLRWELALTFLVAFGLWLLAPRTVLAPDDMVHLVWGSELLHGQRPELTGVARPTPHPLETVLAIPLALFGALADDALRVITLLAFASAGVATIRVGAALVSTPVGVLAGALLLTRPHMAELAQHGDPGILALAFVAWAAAFAVQSPPRDAVVLALLAGGGLLRPEVWSLAFAYAGVVYWRDRRVRPVLALALAGPLLWVAHDWAFARDPLWSFGHTHRNTDLLERRTGLAGALDLLPNFLGHLLALPALLAGVIGVVVGLMYARRATLAIGAVGAIILAGFFALGLAELSLQPRYLVTLAPVVCLFAAIAVLLARPRLVGVLAALVLVAGVPFDLAKQADVRRALQDDGAALEDLLAEGGPARAALERCRPIHVTQPLAFAYVAYWSGLPLGAFTIPPATADAANALVTPTPATVSDVASRPPAVVPPPPGMRLVASNDAWQVYARCRL